MGRHCPPKTTTTTTTTVKITGCDKEAFEKESKAVLTCTSNSVSCKINIS